MDIVQIEAPVLLTDKEGILVPCVIKIVHSPIGLKNKILSFLGTIKPGVTASELLSGGVHEVLNTVFNKKGSVHIETAYVVLKYGQNVAQCLYSSKLKKSWDINLYVEELPH